jgi:hypothetical protein
VQPNEKLGASFRVAVTQTTMTSSSAAMSTLGSPS